MHAYILARTNLSIESKLEHSLISYISLIIPEAIHVYTYYVKYISPKVHIYSKIIQSTFSIVKYNNFIFIWKIKTSKKLDTSGVPKMVIALKWLIFWGCSGSLIVDLFIRIYWKYSSRKWSAWTRWYIPKVDKLWKLLLKRFMHQDLPGITYSWIRRKWNKDISKILWKST